MKMGELNVEIEICCRAEFITYACEILRKSVKVFCRFLNFFTERREKRVSGFQSSRFNGCQRASNGRRSDLLAGIRSQFALGMSREEMLMHTKRGVLHAENSFLYTRGYSSLSYLFMLFVFKLFMLFLHVNI